VKLTETDNHRYAAHLGLKNSLTGAFAMYEIIQTMDVYVSDSIFKSVSIDQGSETVIVQQDTAYLHIEEFEAKLRIYVPKSKKRRLVCFSRHLPIAILKRFDVSNFSRGSELGSIITAPSLFAVDELLSFAGIIEVAGIERPEVEEDSDDESCTSEDGNLASDAENISEPQTSHQNAGYFSPRDRINVVVGDNPFLSPGTITPATTIFSGSPSPLERRNLYKQLLEAVTAQAETLTVGALPLVGNYVVVEAPASRGLITSLAVSSDVIGEREFKIGAAGELFVSKALNHFILQFC
jgi:hypothetical protein